MSRQLSEKIFLLFWDKVTCMNLEFDSLNSQLLKTFRKF